MNDRRVCVETTKSTRSTSASRQQVHPRRDQEQRSTSASRRQASKAKQVPNPGLQLRSNGWGRELRSGRLGVGRESRIELLDQVVHVAGIAARVADEESVVERSGRAPASSRQPRRKHGRAARADDPCRSLRRLPPPRSTECDGCRPSKPRRHEPRRLRAGTANDLHDTSNGHHPRGRVELCTPCLHSTSGRRAGAGRDALCMLTYG